MDAKTFVDRLKAKEIELYGIGDRLKCKDPRDVITSDNLALLKRRKADVLKVFENHAPIKVPDGGTINQTIQGDSFRFDFLPSLVSSSRSEKALFINQYYRRTMP